MKALSELELDATDLAILEQLQENCKRPLAAIGEKVGLTAPSVVDRIHKMEEAGIVREYVAVLDARRLGHDVTAFIGVRIDHPHAIASFERSVERHEEVLECHHVTGPYSLMLKVKVEDTEGLERVIDRLREVDAVEGTETMVVLSTQTERTRIPLPAPDSLPRRRRGGRHRRGGESQPGVVS